MAERELPSQVTDRDFLYMPPEDEVSGDEDWAQCGKWVIHLTEFGMEMLDKMWLSLQPLLSDGTLIMLKASTAQMELENAHIQCFTKPGKDRAKKAAEAMRQVFREEGVDFNGITYYKQNELTIQGIANRKGHKNHTKYMHTFLGRFYERDELNNWRLDDNDESNIATSISSKFSIASSLGSSELPSTSRKRFIVQEREGSDELEANWYTYSTCTQDDDLYLSPADRIWMVATELYDQGIFDKISWSKRFQKVEIRFYGLIESDVHDQLPVCDRIFKEAAFRGIMYYHRSDSTKYSYKYTSENELYEQRQFGEIYVPN